MKQCITCKDNLPLSAFYKSRWSKDGRINQCKECRKQQARGVYYKRISRRAPLHAKKIDRGLASLELIARRGVGFSAAFIAEVCQCDKKVIELIELKARRKLYDKLRSQRNELGI